MRRGTRAYGISVAEYGDSEFLFCTGYAEHECKTLPEKNVGIQCV